MADNAVTASSPEGVPEVPADADNEALIDARKTFVITVIGAALFGVAAVAIILGLGM